ncbi:MAG TPA: ankyrin repeat domain-containing protein [Sphingomicrobium sp.]|jgi:ankyrin repeat protein|nr:ankyrin repeat domain-containing protein [Sphingomicrobium sp.]
MKLALWSSLAIAFAIFATPLSAQSLPTGSEGEAFLKALEERDNNKALPMISDVDLRVVNYRGYKGDAAIHIVTRQRQLDWVGFLLSKGANPNVGDANGDTPLIIASRIGFDDAARVLLRYKANVDAVNRRGETALIVAVQQRQPRMVELLMKSGADPDKTDHAAGFSARDYAKRDTRNRDLLKLIETTKSTKAKVAGPSLD